MCTFPLPISGRFIATGEPMIHVLAFAMQKGGVGKTTAMLGAVAPG
jgi:hypothetical protein